MAGTAELIETQLVAEQLEGINLSLPDVIVVPEMLTDQETRSRAARLIGAVVLGSNELVEVSTIQNPIESLYEAIHRAKKGDEEADALVEANVASDAIERTIKKGHVTRPVPLQVTTKGKILQHGQYMDSVQANSLRYASGHPIMRSRTEAETRNGFRTEELNRAGYFEYYSLVVISRAEKLPGFFTDTMACCIQVTAKQGDGLAIESAFVSGIAKPGEDPHDEETVIKVGKRFNTDFTNKTPAEIIDTPVLVRNDLIPNGAIDMARIFDECAGTFFGEDKPQQDYLEYLSQCRQREETYKPKIRQIKAELLAEADNINTPVQAVKKLHELSEKHMVEQALYDKNINPEVFGPVSAAHIELARLHIALGNKQTARAELSEALNTAKSYSCPSALLKESDNDLALKENSDSSQNEDGDCEFISKSCPECGAKNVKTVVKKDKKTKQKTISGACGCSVTIK
jgi:hypothetical protein